MTSISESAVDTQKDFKFRVEIPGFQVDSVQIRDSDDHEAVTPKVDKISVDDFFEEWANQCSESNKLPETVDYGRELGEGDYLVGAVTSKGTLIAAEFGEIDEDTEVSILYVRRRNGQMDFITHDNVYMNTYPVSYRTLNKEKE